MGSRALTACSTTTSTPHSAHPQPPLPPRSTQTQCCPAKRLFGAPPARPSPHASASLGTSRRRAPHRPFPHERARENAKSRQSGGRGRRCAVALVCSAKRPRLPQRAPLTARASHPQPRDRNPAMSPPRLRTARLPPLPPPTTRRCPPRGLDTSAHRSRLCVVGRVGCALRDRPRRLVAARPFGTPHPLRLRRHARIADAVDDAPALPRPPVERPRDRVDRNFSALAPPEPPPP